MQSIISSFSVLFQAAIYYFKKSYPCTNLHNTAMLCPFDEMLLPNRGLEAIQRQDSPFCQASASNVIADEAPMLLNWLGTKVLSPHLHVHIMGGFPGYLRSQRKLNFCPSANGVFGEVTNIGGSRGTSEIGRKTLTSSWNEHINKDPTLGSLSCKQEWFTVNIMKRKVGGCNFIHNCHHLDWIHVACYIDFRRLILMLQ